MTDETIAFTGSVPGFYDRCLGPFLFEGHAIDLAERFRQEQPARILETACGTGRVTRHLLAGLNEQQALLATDLNADMIAEARAAVPSDARLSWATADLQALPYADAAFDAVVCQFGLMFLPDRPAGMCECRRVLAPGGRLLLGVWNSLQHNPAPAAVHRMLQEWFPVDPPPFMLLPHSMHDPAALRTLALDAGFSEASVERVDLRASITPDALASGFLLGTPLRAVLGARAIDPDALRARTAAALAEQFGDGPAEYPLSAFVLDARA